MTHELGYRFAGAVTRQGPSDDFGHPSVSVGGEVVWGCLVEQFATHCWWVEVTVLPDGGPASRFEGVLRLEAGRPAEPLCADGCCGDYGAAQQVVIGDVDLLDQLPATGNVQVVVEGTALDPHTDPRHPRYDPIVEVQLAHFWNGHRPGDKIKVTQSEADRLRRSARLVNPKAALLERAWELAAVMGREDQLHASPMVLVVAGVPRPQGSKKAFIAKGKGGTQVARMKESSDVEPWRESIRAAALCELAHRGPARPWLMPIELDVTFEFPRPRSHYRTGKNAHLLKDSAPEFPTTRAQGDHDKLVRAVGDALGSAGVYADDSQIVESVVRKRWADFAPRAVIKVGPMPGYEPDPRDVIVTEPAPAG